MTYNINYDICAFFLGISLLICFYYKKYIPDAQNKIYLAMQFVSLITLGGELMEVFGRSYPELFSHAFADTGAYIYLFGINVLPALYTYFIITLTNTKRKVLKFPFCLLIFLPLAISFLLLAFNPLTKWVCYYDAMGQYQRGAGMVGLFGMAAYYLLFGVVYVTRYRKIIPKPKRISLYAFALLAGVPAFAQMLMRGTLISMFGIELCMMLIFMTIQNPDELIHSSTRLFNREAFVSMAEIHFSGNVSFCTISARVVNYMYFSRILGSERMSGVQEAIARRLEQLTAKNKALYCFGDGHFMIVVPISVENAMLAEQIKEILEAPRTDEQIEIKLEARVCVINCPEDADTIPLLLDYSRYNDKYDHERPVIFASKLGITTTRRVFDIERAIQTALQNGGFEVYFQAIYSTELNRINAAEALLRLNDKELGFIPPDEFIPIIEKSGLIIEVGMLVFQKVCRFVAENDMDALGLDYLEINLSVVQCMQNKLAEQLIKVIEEYRIEPCRINLEITETVAAYSTQTLARNMAELVAYGVSFSLDDYGTGYSNMISMIELPFKNVKLDKSIVQAVDKQKAYIAMRSTIAMLKQLDMHIIAEGIETNDQRKILTDMGCDSLQGYYFSRPIPKPQFVELLRNPQLSKK